MKIVSDFPFDCCGKCKSIRPYTNVQRLYGDMKVVEQEIIVGCEHEQECAAIHQMMEEQMKE